MNPDDHNDSPSRNKYSMPSKALSLDLQETYLLWTSQDRISLLDRIRATHGGGKANSKDEKIRKPDVEFDGDLLSDAGMSVSEKMISRFFLYFPFSQMEKIIR